MSFGERISSFIKKPLKPSHAIILAVASLWLLGIALSCLHTLIYGGSHRSFYFWHSYGANVDEAFIRELVVVLFISHFTNFILPSLLAGYIIAKSTFKRPLTVSFFVAFVYYSLRLVIVILRRPWANAPVVAQTTILYSELVGTFLLICLMIFSTWLMSGPVWKFLRSLRNYQVILITAVLCILVIIGHYFMGRNIVQIIEYLLGK